MSRLLDATIHTSLYAPSATHDAVATRRIQTSWLNRLPWLRGNHRWAFPVLAPAFAAMRPKADTTILSTIGWAHFARPAGRRVAFWHAPARWLHQTDVYVGFGARGRAVRALNPILKRWDRHAVRSIDLHLANSTEIANRIRAIYDVEVEVVYPPITFAGRPAPVADLAPGYLLVVSRFLSYKNIDRVIAAVDGTDHQLVVVGSGPDEARLRSLSGRNVRFLGQPNDDQLAWLYQQAAALVTAAHEDFGLTPLEAAMFGTPTAALRAGGFLDTIVEGETGVFFDSTDASAIRDGIDAVLSRAWDGRALRAQAARFSESAFQRRLAAVLDDEALVDTPANTAGGSCVQVKKTTPISPLRRDKSAT